MSLKAAFHLGEPVLGPWYHACFLWLWYFLPLIIISTINGRPIGFAAKHIYQDLNEEKLDLLSE